MATEGNTSDASNGPGDRVITLPWHRPRCSACGEQIVETGDALAVWFADHLNHTHTPMLLHGGACWKRLPAHHQNSTLEALRRSPLDAVLIAMRRRAHSEAERLVWVSWIGVVLGLPTVDEAGRVADLPEHVMTIREARLVTGEGAVS